MTSESRSRRPRRELLEQLGHARRDVAAGRRAQPRVRLAAAAVLTSSQRSSMRSAPTPASVSRSRVIASSVRPASSTASPSRRRRRGPRRRLAQRGARARGRLRSSVPSMSKSSRAQGQRGSRCPGPAAARTPRSAVAASRRRRAGRSRPASACSAAGSRRRSCGMPARVMWKASASVPVARAEAVDGERDALGLAPPREQLEDARVRASSRASMHRPAAELVLAQLLADDARRVGRVGHVDRDRDVRAQRVRGGARAAEGDLLLRDRDGVRRRRARRPPRRRAARPPAPRSSRGGCPSSARHDAVVGQLDRLARRSPRRRRCGPAPRASSPSLAPMSMCRSFSCGTFLRSSSFSRWIGFLPTTPGDHAGARRDLHALADEDRPGPSRRRR